MPHEDPGEAESEAGECPRPYPEDQEAQRPDE